MADDVPLMTKEELQSRMEQGGVVVVDVRSGRDWNSSEFKITGAQRPDGKDVAAWAGGFDKNKTTVLYCA
jgi:rhodanese-related sulfurtransferase